MLTMKTCRAAAAPAPLAPRPCPDQFWRMSLARRLGKLPVPFASAPTPVRLMAGLGLLGLCLWLPAFIALFR